MNLLAAIDACGILPGLPCATGGAAGGVAYTGAVILPALYYIFFAVTLLFFFYYAVRLMVESEDSSTIDETKSAYAYAITGAVVVSLAGFLVEAVGPGFASRTLINPAPVSAAVGNTVLFFRLILSAAVSGVIVYQGFRLILLQGQESEMEQQKKRFFYGLIGVAAMLLADVIVNSFLPGSGSSALAVQIVGIVNFLLEILGGLAILAFVVAGIMLVFSTDEELKDRAKKTMFTTVVGLILVLVSYVIVKFTVNVTTGVDFNEENGVSLPVSLTSSLLALIVPAAHAQSVSGVASGVSNGLIDVFNGGGFVGIASAVIGSFRGIIVTVGVMIVVRAAMKLVTSQDEDKLTTARRTIASTCVGVMFAFMAERLVAAFYTPGGTWNAGTVQAGATILAVEIGGIIDWALVTIVVLSILMIVVSAIRAIGSFGKEDAGDVKRTINGVITGLGLILLSGAIKMTLGLTPDLTPAIPGTPDAGLIIARGAAVVVAVLQFLALGAVAVIIYAGMMMVLNFGEDDRYEKAKGIVKRAVIGLVVVLLSVVAIRFIVDLFI